jgi:uncharacterized protein
MASVGTVGPIETSSGSKEPGAAASAAGTNRVTSLDFIRGIAVLGILASNIVTYARPNEARRVVALVHEVGWQEWLPWMVNYIVVDGKFRSMFAALFGAGLVIFMERARARGAPARWLQLRRLFWLILFGAFHYAFLFEGDILLQYALIGFLAVWIVFWSPRLLLWLGVLLICFDTTLATAELGRLALEEQSVLAMPASSPERLEYEAYWQGAREKVAEESEIMTGSMSGIIAHRFRSSEAALEPIMTLQFVVFQYLPMMMIGAALYRLGFFSGGWDRRRMLGWGIAGIAIGSASALALGLWLMRSGWPFDLNYFVFYGPVGILRLPVTLGYMAVMVALVPCIAPTALGRRISAAGQMALTNYIGTSFVMAFIFQGWGLGLFDRFSRFEQWGFMLLGFALMLGWSQSWLARYRFGPLEWLWRCLTYWRLFPLRREPA